MPFKPKKTISNVPSQIVQNCKIAGQTEVVDSLLKRVVLLNRTTMELVAAQNVNADNTWEIFSPDQGAQNHLLIGLDEGGNFNTDSFDRVSLGSHTFSPDASDYEDVLSNAEAYYVTEVEHVNFDELSPVKMSGRFSGEIDLPDVYFVENSFGGQGHFENSSGETLSIGKETTYPMLDLGASFIIGSEQFIIQNIEDKSTVFLNKPVGVNKGDLLENNSCVFNLTNKISNATTTGHKVFYNPEDYIQYAHFSANVEGQEKITDFYPDMSLSNKSVQVVNPPTHTRNLGSNHEGTAGASVNGDPVDNGDYYTFDGIGDGLKFGSSVDEANLEVHAKVVIRDKYAGEQIIWESGGSSRGLALGINASGDLGIFTNQDEIIIPPTDYSNDVLYDIYATKTSLILADGSTGNIVKTVVGYITQENGSSEEGIGCNNSGSAMPLDSDAYFNGDIYEINLYPLDSIITIADVDSGVRAFSFDYYAADLDNNLIETFLRVNKIIDVGLYDNPNRLYLAVGDGEKWIEYQHVDLSDGGHFVCVCINVDNVNVYVDDMTTVAISSTPIRFRKDIPLQIGAIEAYDRTTVGKSNSTHVYNIRAFNHLPTEAEREILKANSDSFSPIQLPLSSVSTIGQKNGVAYSAARASCRFDSSFGDFSPFYNTPLNAADVDIKARINTKTSSVFSIAKNIISVPEDYSDLQNAINAAQNGDLIKIAPGNYSSQYTLKDKVVHLYGDTNDPVGNPIVFDRGYRAFIFIFSPNLSKLIVKNLGLYPTIYIQNIKLSQDSTDYKSVRVDTQSSSPYFEVNFLNCTFRNTGTLFETYRNTDISKLKFFNCTLETDPGNFHFENFNQGFSILTDIELHKCLILPNLNISGSGIPSVFDHVTSPTEEYGAEYEAYPNVFDFKNIEPIYFSIPESSVEKTVYDVPVPIDLSPYPDLFNTVSGPSDISVIFQDGTVLDIEVESFDISAQKALLWVKMPFISETNTTYYAVVYKHSESDMSDFEGAIANAIWQDFDFVYHMGKDPVGTGSCVDSSGKNHADPSNMAPANKTFAPLSSYEYSFDGTQSINAGNLLPEKTTEGTIEVVFKTAQNAGHILSQDADGWNDRDVNVSIGDPTGVVNTVADGYLNFETSGPNTSESNNVVSTVPVNDGNYHYVGLSWYRDNFGLVLDESVDVPQIEYKMWGETGDVQVGTDGTDHFSGSIAEVLITDKFKDEYWHNLINKSLNDSLITYEENQGDPTWLGDWAKRIPFIIDHTKIDSDLTHFPIPIVLDGTFSKFWAGERENKIGTLEYTIASGVYFEAGSYECKFEVYDADSGGNETALRLEGPDTVEYVVPIDSGNESWVLTTGFLNVTTSGTYTIKAVQLKDITFNWGLANLTINNFESQHSDIFRELGENSKKIAVATLDKTQLYCEIEKWGAKSLYLGTDVRKTQCTASSVFSTTSYPAKYAFDGNLSSEWISNNGGSQVDGTCWLQWDFGGSKTIADMRMAARNSGRNQFPENIGIYGSDIGAFLGEQIHLGDFALSQPIGAGEYCDWISIDTPQAFRYLRIEIYTQQDIPGESTDSWVAVGDTEFKEKLEKAVIWVSRDNWTISSTEDTEFYLYYDATKEDNVEVTSLNINYGSYYGSGLYRGSYSLAFDRVYGNGTDNNDSWESDGSNTGWIGCSFNSDTIITKMFMIPRNDAQGTRCPSQFEIRAANSEPVDGINEGTVLFSTSGVSWLESGDPGKYFEFNNNAAYTHYWVVCLDKEDAFGKGAEYTIGEIEFYERTSTGFVGDMGQRPEVWNPAYNFVSHDGGLTDSTINANYTIANGGLSSNDLIYGQIGEALVFDGSDDSITVGNTAQLNDLTQFTIDTVAKPFTAPDWTALATKTATNSHVSIQLGIMLDNNGIYPIMNGNNYFKGSLMPDLESYYHNSLTFDGSTMNWFNAGSSIGTVAELTPSSNEDWNIGDFTGQSSYEGILDEIRFSAVSRSSEWIKADYHAQTNNLLFSNSFEQYTGGYDRVNATFISPKALSNVLVKLDLHSASGITGYDCTSVLADSTKIYAGNNKVEKAYWVDNTRAILWALLENVVEGENTVGIFIGDETNPNIGEIGSAIGQEVFQDFKAVYHLCQDPSVAIKDSTGNNPDATPVNMDASNLVDAETIFNGADESINLGEIFSEQQDATQTHLAFKTANSSVPLISKGSEGVSINSTGNVKINATALTEGAIAVNDDTLQSISFAHDTHKRDLFVSGTDEFPYGIFGSDEAADIMIAGNYLGASFIGSIPELRLKRKSEYQDKLVLQGKLWNETLNETPNDPQLIPLFSFDQGNTYKIWNGAWRSVVSKDETVHGNTGDSDWYYIDDTDTWIKPTNNTLNEALELATEYDENKVYVDTIKALTSAEWTATGGMTSDGYFDCAFVFNSCIKTMQPSIEHVTVDDKMQVSAQSFDLEPFDGKITGSKIEWNIKITDPAYDYSQIEVHSCITGGAWQSCTRNGEISGITAGMDTTGLTLQFKVLAPVDLPEGSKIILTPKIY